ncbi:MAG: branched-chain amino acid ABC transporter permease [Burkholderiaceae bacterium]|nr:branched-chain amino acid ABC transporter permease [Burkholderiaceae bacterium]
MDLSIAAILAQDGLTSGAIYALLALALVLVFSVTRVIFIPQGEYVAFGALTLAALQVGKFPYAVWLLLGLGVTAFVMELAGIARSPARRRRALREAAAGALQTLLMPALVCTAALLLPRSGWPMAAQVAFTLAAIVPMGPLLYRIAYQPLASASTLVLLIVSVGVHYALIGIGLLMFGAEGARTEAFTDLRLEIGVLTVSGQSLAVIVAAFLLIGLLYLYFGRTLSGKALRATAVTRMGAQIVGIGITQAGRLSFLLAATLGTLCGILIAPFTTVYYDSGFLIGLKGFVGAIIGGMASYPIAAAGAILVGLIESYASFWASAYKEVIVFTLIIPVLLWRSLSSTHHDEDEADDEGAA